MAELYAIDPEPRGTDVVAMLEDLLEKATAGEISSLAFAGIRCDGETTIGYTYGVGYQMLGAIAQLQHDLLTGGAGQ